MQGHAGEGEFPNSQQKPPILKATLHYFRPVVSALQARFAEGLGFSGLGFRVLSRYLKIGAWGLLLLSSNKPA